MLQLSYDQLRECVVEVYHKRGYHGATDLISLLSSGGLIGIKKRSYVSDLLNTLVQYDEKVRNDKKLKNLLK